MPNETKRNDLIMRPLLQRKIWVRKIECLMFRAKESDRNSDFYQVTLPENNFNIWNNRK